MVYLMKKELSEKWIEMLEKQDPYMKQQFALFIGVLGQHSPAMADVVAEECIKQGRLPTTLVCNPTDEGVLKVSYSSYCKDILVNPALPRGQFYFSWLDHAQTETLKQHLKKELAAYGKRLQRSRFWQNMEKIKQSRRRRR